MLIVLVPADEHVAATEVMAGMAGITHKLALVEVTVPQTKLLSVIISL